MKQKHATGHGKEFGTKIAVRQVAIERDGNGNGLEDEQNVDADDPLVLQEDPAQDLARFDIFLA